MPGDVLIDLLRRVQGELPGVPPERWAAIEAALRADYGGDEHYISRRSKATLLGRLQAASAEDRELSAADLAERLQISVRHARRLKRLQGR